MAQVKEISVTEYQQLVQTEKVILCDIREPDEHNRDRIAEAINTPISSFHSSDLNLLGKDAILVFHCQSGNRTRLNANKFSNLNCEKTYILAGGINEWKKAGLRTIKDEKAPLPIMRQVQMIAGSLILLGVILSLLVHPWFILLSGFVGAGLFVAGATGFCGMANILMLLPYNRRQCQASCNKN